MRYSCTLALLGTCTLLLRARFATSNSSSVRLGSNANNTLACAFALINDVTTS